MTSLIFAAALAVTVDAREFGLRESDLLQTAAIQAAIDRVAAQGGGEAVIPEGRYRTGGLVLKSGVTLRLAEGAELEGDRNPENYPGSNRWYRALVRADGAHDVGVVGGRHSTINGMNCYDARGEEGYRGPHALMFLNCTNVTLGGYVIRDSANWGHAIFHCVNVKARNVKVFGGHDAFDFHDSENVDVASCEFHTGDDCVAGYANRHCVIRDCVLDTSCQAVRIGGNDILFERCRLVSPSAYGHRWGMTDEKKRLAVNAGEGIRHGAMYGVIYYCDTRWKIDRPQRDIVFRDCTFDRPGCAFALEYDGRNMWCCRHPLESIVFERCTFNDVEKPIAIYGDEAKPLDFTLRNCTVRAAKGCATQEVLTAYNFKKLTVEGTTFAGYDAPHLVTRSEGEVCVRGGTELRRVHRPDPLDKTLTFAECRAAASKLPRDVAGWKRWSDGIPTPSESRWSEEKGLYVSAANPQVVDVWGSALAVLRGETPHADRIARSLCRGYQYYVGWGRTGAVKPDGTPQSELSPLPAGAFGFAMAKDDPLFARTFFTDFLRRKDLPPAAVSGALKALDAIMRDKVSISVQEESVK